MSDADLSGGDRLLTFEEVGERLRRPVSSIRRLCDQGHIAWMPGQPRMVRAAALWDYLVAMKDTRPYAYADEPLSSGAAAALNAARERVLHEHLAYPEMENRRRYAGAEWDALERLRKREQAAARAAKDAAKEART